VTLTIERFTPFEARLESLFDRDDPFQDVEVTVELRGPGGRVRRVDAFWDGGRAFRFRFAPDELGAWTWRSAVLRSSAEARDVGLDGVTGSFTCVPNAGASPLDRHGPPRVAADRSHFEHADGTPFFWLGDTAWNGPLKASAGDWDAFCAERRGKRFTTVQVVLTQWLASAGDAEGRQAFLGRERIQIDPFFFQRLDERMATIARHGLVAVPILIWAAHWNANTLTLNPGTFLPDDQIVKLARYLLARYGAQPAIWMLAGDADYTLDGSAERWRAIGRAVFADRPDAIVTMHPAGQVWVGPQFRNEPWFSFIGYQGGHGDDDKTFRWLVEGPPAKDWSTAPSMPVVNLEPNYEAHLGYTTKRPHDALAVRRASYWSLLVSPPAGVTYGAHGVWSWESTPAIPMAHLGAGVAPPWREAMALPGSTHMRHLVEFFTSFEWWTLRPSPESLAVQPGDADTSKFIAVARSRDGHTLAAYLPAGGPIALRPAALPTNAVARWFDPRAGAWLAPVAATPELRAPDERDWVLLVEQG
jgi:hypothetical protein